MNRLALILLSSPTLLGSMLSVLLTVSPTHAAEPTGAAVNSCWSEPTHRTGRLTCVRLSQTAQPATTANNTEAQTLSRDSFSSSEGSPMLEFSEEESEAAVQLFGCDCIVCINAVRQMRGLAPIT